MPFEGEMQNDVSFARKAIMRLIEENPGCTYERSEIDAIIREAHKDVGGKGFHTRTATSVLCDVVQEGLVERPSKGFYYIPPKNKAMESASPAPDGLAEIAKDLDEIGRRIKTMALRAGGPL